MNSFLLQVFEPTVSPLASATLLARNGFTCTLHTLEPGSEVVLPAGTSPDDQLLFVVDGAIAIHDEDLTTLVNWGEAFLLKPGRTPTISARSDLTVRVLRVEIPPRQIIIPQIITPRT